MKVNKLQGELPARSSTLASMLASLWVIPVLLLSRVSFITTQTCTDGDIRLVSKRICTWHKDCIDSYKQLCNQVARL